MREIKFRAFVYGRMGEPFHPLDSRFLAEGGTFDESAEFMQWTGLYDKDGREIYEGDILQDSSNYKWEVQWHSEHACFMVLSIENGVVAEIIDNINMRVVGNIYQVHELI